MISYVVPVYNAAAFLPKCVDSLLVQRGEMEILLINDGSKDASGAVCDAYAAKESRVRVIHKENGGVASARNAGIDAATGDYILFVDSDDWIEPETGRVLEAVAEAEQADMVAYGMVSEYADSGEHIPMALKDSRVYRGREGVAQAVLSMERQRLLSFPWNKLFRRSFLARTGVRFETIQGPVEDAIFVMGCCRQAECIAMVDKELYHYVQINSDSMVHRYFDGLFEIGIDMNQRRKELYRTLGLVSEEAQNVCADMCFQQTFHSIKNLYRSNAPQAKAQRRAVWRQIMQSQEIREDVRRSASQTTEAKLVQMAISTRSPALANLFFSLLMGARRKLSRLYILFRKHFILGKRRG